jgi:hypothetical protein
MKSRQVARQPEPAKSLIVLWLRDAAECNLRDKRVTSETWGMFLLLPQATAKKWARREDVASRKWCRLPSSIAEIRKARNMSRKVCSSEDCRLPHSETVKERLHSRHSLPQVH